jgi:hypothetical protein
MRKCVSCFNEIADELIAYWQGYDARTLEKVAPVCIFCDPSGDGMARRLEAKRDAVHQGHTPATPKT